LAALFSGRFAQLGALARILKDSAVSILVGQVTKEGPLHEWFDYVFEVRAAGLSSWEAGALVCNRTPGLGTSGVGYEAPLAELPWATDILTAAARLTPS
jgi:hypothetical protein